MTELEENKEKAISYLFAELDDAERDALEDSIFADDDFGLLLSAVEKDLVDDYVRNEMDVNLRQRFERRYLTSESRRERVRLASVLQTEVFNEKVSEPPIIVPSAETKPSFWTALADFFRAPNPALAGGLAVILLFLLFGGWILFRRAPSAPEIVKDDYAIRQTPSPTITPENKPPDENSNVVPTPETNSNQAPAVENKSPKNPSEKRPTPAPRPTERREEVPQSKPRIVFATLFPLLRSDEKPVLTLPKNTDSVRLMVVHDNLKPYAKYRVEIRNQTGEVVFTRDFPVNAKNPARPVSLNIKAAKLGAGNYEMLLSGISEDNSPAEIKSYNFSVKKK